MDRVVFELQGLKLQGLELQGSELQGLELQAGMGKPFLRT
jgi:hypothetical protein